MEIHKLPRRNRTATPERSFLSNAAHELRTPLHSANGFVEMVLDGLAGPLSERQHEMLGYVHTAIGQLATLLEDVLFLARVDNGEVIPHPSRVDPTAIFARSLDSVRDHARERTITIHLTEVEMPRMIVADGERVREGLAGLLRGALALMPAGGTLAVLAGTQGDRLRFALSLDGVRLDSSDVRQLFDRFCQPWPVGAERSVHPGLGLVIARTTATWHGGSCYADEAEDGSLTLCYELPLTQS